MRPTQYTFNAVKKTSFIRSIPVEITPLLIACATVCCSAIFFSTKKIKNDRTLKFGRKNPTFNEKFEEVVNSKE
ncbi:hypothetical protein PACTADRAFT_5100 [Pachysolen tannophilus NRRL Y-2460]|uniref:Uncharacterized protein n=1 Tax=Pachysolen tannophilus NRRL Y-2460 TaxID=669874 RepID=A0A1E4TNH3_PACTA|nr:hypothetical protein PACTADRAFT_5100 [Pachysolen tannophilus NRRL Y-2460]